jgi:hypothetical protein
MTLLSADAYFNRKVKVGNSAKELHLCTCVWFGGWFGTLETSTKALILSISPNYSIYIIIVLSPNLEPPPQEISYREKMKHQTS